MRLACLHCSVGLLRGKGGCVALTTAFWVLGYAALCLAQSTGPAYANVDNEIECLALNIYFEARGEPESGKLAVAHVVMNRVLDPRFPKSVCEVVQQGGDWRLHKCQFSWWCDGRSDRPKDLAAWESSKKMARLVYWGASEDPTLGALWYHADYVTPHWRDAFARGPKIGRHIFYRRQDGRIQLTSSR